MSVIARKTRGGGGGSAERTPPKDLLVKFYETNVASLITKCLTRPAMWMVPEPRPTPESSSSAHFSTASYRIEVTSTDYLYITVIMKL